MLIAIPLMFLLLCVLQVAVFVHERNVIIASAAEGARFGANADVASPDAAARKASDIISRSLSSRVASAVPCRGYLEAGEAELRLIRVRCRGELPTVLGALGNVLAIDVSGRAFLESPL